MIGEWGRIAGELDRFGRLARVAVVRTAGSTPREVGASLILRPDAGFHGTIGGGAFEWRALDLARRALAEPEAGHAFHDVVLGPDLGQCCGGRVTLLVEVFDRSCLAEVRSLAARESIGPFATRARVRRGRIERTPIAGADAAVAGRAFDGSIVEHFGDERRAVFLFGAGHVGRALVLALAPLPFRVAWIDGRDDAFPGAVPGNVELHGPADPVTMVAHAAAGTLVVVATHDHALDLAIVDACLARDDLPHVGVIGSATKRARFSSRLLEFGHTSDAIRRMVCPIGALGPRSKAPAVIAASIAVELLTTDEMARKALGASSRGMEVECEREGAP